MRIYRYEHPVDGRGPYLPRDVDSDDYFDSNLYGLSEELNDKHSDSAHPNRVGDGLPAALPFGAPDLESLREWFYGFHSQLSDHGYEIIVVDVPDDQVQVGLSGKQVTYYPDNSKIIARYKSLTAAVRGARLQATDMTTTREGIAND